VDTHRVSVGGAADIDRLEPLWAGMVRAHAEVVDGAWPVRAPAEAWRRRRAQYAEWLQDASGTLLLAVAVADPSAPPDGYAMVRTEAPGPTWDLGDEVGELESLAVAEHARGAGVGTLLVQAARERLRRAGVRFWLVSVVEANAGAVRLYEREGFRPFYRDLLAPLDPPGR
jgi:ribosomal protein S18 acetylase RimI-like enzyme